MFGYAQNLVPNHSFEDTTSCPVTLADLSKANNWTSPTDGSPDYFNSCNGSVAGVPNNIFGTQSAIDGSAYVGISVYDLNNSYSYREYLQVQLLQTLTVGQKYYVSFYVSLADSNDYAIKEFGAYFSDTFIYSAMDSALSFVPQVQFNGAVITDKNNWTKIAGSFIAAGTENYLVVGNFNRKQTTTALQVGNSSFNYSYYYIDNICVSNDSLSCNQPVGIREIMPQQLFNVFPNPVIDWFVINANVLKEPYDLVVTNALGQKLFEEKNVNVKSKTINANSFNSGIFLINIKTRSHNYYYKLLKP